MSVRAILIGVAFIALAWTVPLAIGGAFSDSIPTIEVGSPAPDFNAEQIPTGDSVTLRDYRGDVVLLNLWATWCAPCLREMPAMERLYQKLGPEGLSVVAVSVDATDNGSIQAFANELNLTFDILYDRSHQIERTYQVMALPQSFVIDRNGVIVWREFGAAAWDEESYLARFRDLLAADPVP